jgi:diguanylate cyclase (GGDEF)-like protein/PAS domain S-box-containing protein
MRGAPAREQRGARTIVGATVALSAAVLVAFVLAPGPNWTQGFYLGGETAAALVISWAAARRSGPARVTWAWLAAGIVATTAADWYWMVWAWITPDLPNVSWPDILYLGCYACLAVGLVRIARSRGRGGQVDPILDAAAVGVLGFLLAWEFVIEPTLTDGSMPLFERVVSSGYPVADVVLLALLAWVTVLDRRPNRQLGLLVAALGCWLAADIAYAVVAQTELYAFGATKAMDGGWLVGAQLFALSALVGQKSDAAAPVPAATPRRRGSASLLFGVGLILVPPTVELVSDALHGEDVPYQVWIAAVVVGALVLLRSMGLMRARDAVEAELNANRRYFMTLAAYSSDALVVLDRRGVIVNDAPRAAALVGQPVMRTRGLSAIDHVHPSDRAVVQRLFEQSWHEPGVVLSTECRLLHADDRKVWVLGRIVNLFADPDIRGFLVNVHDVTDRRAAEERIEHLAFHDALTGLANRALFRDRVGHALRRAARSAAPTAVLLLDIDGFKHVNETLGHDAGDELLREVAERLRAALRTADTVARLGGDEFAVLVEDMPSSDEAPALAERLLEAVTAPVVLRGTTISLAATIGVALAAAEDDASALLRNADIALAEAKSADKGRWVLFDAGMQRATRERLRLAADLNRVVEGDELRVVYQPVIELHDGRVVGFEALARWEHPELGLVTPDRFIPLAEENGLIVALGRSVLAEAAATAVRWQREFPSDPPLSMAVNLSARQLDSPDLVATVAHVLETSGLAPSSLVLEMTESVLVANPDEAARRLHELRALGIRLAIDDFGTGYSSLSYLRQFPVDILKIDRSFVRTIGEEEQLPALVRGLLELGRTLGLEVVAEGIELDHQLRQLQAEHCKLGQGYLFARPLAEIDAEALLVGLTADGTGRFWQREPREL